MTTEMLDVLDQIYTNANGLVTGMDDDQWHLPTPCTEWNVRQLVNHITHTSAICQAAANREPQPGVGDYLGDDPVAAFATVAQATQLAWRAEGATDGDVSVPASMPAVAALGVNILDVGIHCWDLATAIGRPHGLSGGVVAVMDEWTRRLVTPEVRPRRGFGDDLGPQGDDLLINLLAFTGRKAG